MTDPGKDTLLLIPPPGPLAWLHPELEKLSVPRPAQRSILDLGRTGLFGESLREALLKHPSQGIKVQDGPRGYALWTWLSQALRNTSKDLSRPSPTPSGRPGCDSLETVLAEAAEEKGRDGAVWARREDNGEVMLQRTALTKGQARNFQKAGQGGEKGLWLLPFVPGSGLKSSLEDALKAVSHDPPAFSAAGLLPYFSTQFSRTSKGRGSSAAVETRLLPGWWGLLPGDEYPADVRTLFRELMRLLHPDRMFLFLSLENYALAGIDSYVETIMNRFKDRPFDPAPREGLPLILGVCGTDGSGKSSHVDALETFFKEQGLKVRRHKIYRHGIFHDTVTDLTRQCAGDRNLHLWRLQRIVKVFDSIKYFYAAVEGDLKDCDVIIFDRYIFTHFAAGMGRYHADPFSRELLEVFPSADRIYLLDVPTDEALRRIGTREEKTVDENPYMLSRYRHALCDLGGRFGFLVLDARAPFEENRRIILEDAARLLEDRDQGGG